MEEPYLRVVDAVRPRCTAPRLRCCRAAPTATGARARLAAGRWAAGDARSMRGVLVVADAVRAPATWGKSMIDPDRPMSAESATAAVFTRRFTRKAFLLVDFQ